MHEQNQPTVLQTPGQVRTPDLLDHAQHLKAEARTIMGKFFDTQKEWIKNHPLGVIGNIVEVTAIMATPLAPNLGIGLILPYIGHMLNVRARILEDNARGLEQGHKDSISPKNIPMELVGATRAVILGILMRLPYYSPYTFQPSTGFPVLDKAIATASQEAYRFATTKHLSQGVGVAETAAPVTPTVMPTEVVPTVTDIAAQAPSVVDGSVPSITGIEPTQAVEQTKIIAHSAAEAAQAGA